MSIAASTVPVLVPGKTHKDAVNGGGVSWFRSGRGIWTIGACEVRDVEIMRFRCEDGRWR